MLNTTNIRKKEVQSGPSAVKKLINMLFIIIILMISGKCTLVNAQTGSPISYQGVARNAAGNIVANQPISLRISILQGGATTGTLVYQETHNPTTNSLGLFNVYITNGATTGTFDPLKWEVLASIGAFIKVEMDINGGSAYADMGTTQLLSVPFALYSKIAGSTPGSVNFKGTWDASSGAAPIAGTPDAKGYYYVVTTAGSTNLDGITDWQVGDWAIYNGTIWQKVDNSQAPVGASDVSFVPTTSISSTNVQGAIEEVDAKWAVLSSLGAVVYSGTWDAATNNPSLTSGIGTKGNYYVVSTASSNTNLNGITVWNVGDWAIYNGSAWEKVDNTGSVSDGAHLPFTPNGDITSINVQDAIVEVRDDTDTKLTGKANAVSGVANNFAKLNGSGQLLDSGFSPDDFLDKGNTVPYTPVADYNPATKRYVDDAVGTTNFVPLTRTVNGHALSSDVTVTKSDVGLGNVLNLDFTNAANITQDATHRFVSDTEKSTWNGKLNLAGGTMTGNLILNAAPTTALGAATKQYVDAIASLSLGTKADKVVGATTDDIAILDASGNLVDSGKKPGDFLPSSTQAVNIPFTANAAITSTNVQGAIEEVNGQFTDLIDSFISRTDDGVTVYPVTGTTHKRFGIGDTAPLCPLGIKGEDGGDDGMICFTSGDGTHKWNINLNPSPSDIPGFSIDNTSTGTAVTRFFINEVSGNVSVGDKITDRYLLGLKTYDPLRVSLGITNTADSVINSGWSLSHVHDNSVPEKNGAFSIFEEGLVAAATVERITILPTITTPASTCRNVGINETLPYATLHVSRAASDPQTAIDTSLGTGIIMIGETVGTNLVLDNHGIQAREYNPSKQYIIGDTQLYLQSLGGGIVIHSNSSLPSDKAIITHDAKLGLGTITPVEKIDVDGAIKIGTTLTNNPGTIRWSGSDFEGYDGSVWKSFTTSNWAGTLALSGAPAITYNPANAKVGIGVSQPASALHVEESSTVTNASTCVQLNHHGSSTSSSSFDSRVGLAITCTGAWSSNAAAKNIGLYVSNVTGQAANESNIAAVLNGNVVIGDVTSSAIIGTNGKRVLGFQTGDIPTQAMSGTGPSNGGIQIYSEDLSTGSVSPPVSVFSVMTGDGHVVKLFGSPAITAPDNSTINTTYGTNEQTIINNMRDRINQLEAILINHGLLN